MASKMLTDKVQQPLKIQKVNIGMTEDPKFANVGDYSNEDTMVKITDLLYEFQDLFLKKIVEMKGILGDLGKMKIPLNPEVKPIKKHPYWLNPWYKERVKNEIDRMLDDGIIDLGEEFEWMSPMVVQDKNTADKGLER